MISLDLFAVIPAVAGPLQILLTLLPGLLLAIGGALISLFRPRTALMAVKLAWRLKWQLAVVAIVVVGMGWACYQLPALVQAQTTDAEPTDQDWPTTRGNLARTGVVDKALAPNRSGRNWTWRNGDAAVFASPAVVGNRVYFSTSHLALVGDGTGEVIALDADTGKVAWKAAPPNYRATFSSAVVSGNKLVIGEGLHTVTDARIICLDLTPGREGQLLWSHRTKGHVESTPLIDGDRVYVGAGDDGVYCLALDGDGDGNAKVIWHAKGDRCIDAETTPVVWRNKAGKAFVIVCLGVDGNAIVSLNAETGEEIHRQKTAWPIFGTPALTGDQLIVGMGVGDMVRRAEELGKQPAGEVYAVDLKRLCDADKPDPLLWRFKAKRTILGAVAIHKDRVYFGSRDEYLYCLNLQGELISKWDAGSAIATSPAVTDDYVYVMTDSGMLYALNRESLTPLWEERVGRRPTYVSSPTVARGQIFVGSQFDGVCSIGKADFEKQAPLWPTALAGAGGNLRNEQLSPAGAFEWQFPADLTGESEEAAVIAPTAAIGSQVFIGLADPEQSGIVCLPADANGDETPNTQWERFATRQPVALSPAVSGKYVLAVDGVIGESGRSLYCIDKATGRLNWKVIVSTYSSGIFYATHHHVLVQDVPGRLASRDIAERGKKRWAANVGELSQPPVVAGAIAIVAADKPPMLFALDQGTGKTLWKEPLPAIPVAAPVVHQKSIYLALKSGLVSHSLLTGKPTEDWQIKSDAPAGPIVVDQSGVLFVSTAGELIATNHTGEIDWKAPNAIAGFSPLVADDQVMFISENDLRVVPRDGGKAAVWLDTSWLGKPTTSLILHRGKVYQGREGWGMIRLGAAR